MWSPSWRHNYDNPRTVHMRPASDDEMWSDHSRMRRVCCTPPSPPASSRCDPNAAAATVAAAVAAAVIATVAAAAAGATYPPAQRGRKSNVSRDFWQIVA